ncbi:DUF4245 domain-containing protein [Actinomadura decatromicini]|uniref:DUF4245 domain-containing protein n=1 Tax=Actinomadura decatromicini TaxID=2604572 RepID=A0A5D3FQ96_9ACTN|nr:DUF4245 domain-containing protein [Actinomadura decatromicini]TYK49275.1 DUF4245 domain-containing protein [Actinomadura decatromicini]
MTDKTPSSVPDAATDAADAADAPPPEGASGGRPVVEVSPAVHKRLTTGLGGFAMAMGACLVLVFAIYLIAPRSESEVEPVVDYGSQLWAMRGDAPYTVHAPEGLPPGWRPTSSRLTGLGSGAKGPVAWHLGFVTPSDEYAALEQSNEKASEFVPRMANSSKPTGTRTVNGVAWTTYLNKGKKANTLARTLPDGTSLVVTGTASYAELAVLAGALKPQAKTGGLTPSATATPRS